MTGHRSAGLIVASLFSATCMTSPAAAQNEPPPSANEIRAEIDALRAETDARIEQIRRDTDMRIDSLLWALAAIERGEKTPGILAESPPPDFATPSVVSPASSLDADTSDLLSRLDVSGDVRLRYERNTGASRPQRERGVFRARVKAELPISRNFMVGGRLVTGNPDDPNTADVTLTEFDDDLIVALDQAYAQAKFGPATLVGGKFDNPFRRTDLVWDGDVNPQGLTGMIELPVSSALAVRAATIHFFIDENAGGSDSAMDGGQLTLAAKYASDFSAELSGSYYRYRLGSLAGADAGDFRSNLIAGRRYVSDFRLGEILGTLSYSGFGDRFPVSVVGDYVKNFGAAVAGDSGFSADVIVGRASKARDWRFQYSYAEMGVDGVFAAFSHDNTDLATNYIQHTLVLDYVPLDNVVLDLTYYRYRLKNPLYGGALPPGEWADRMRLNMIFSF